MIVGSEGIYEDTKKALERVQQFDTSSLPRTADLGSRINFEEAQEPAQLLVDIFKRLSVVALEDFPDPILKTIQDNSNNIYNLFNQVLEFDVEQTNPSATRNTIVERIKSSYPAAFQAMHPYISYSLHRSADFQRLDSQARATFQSIEDKATEISVKLAGYEEDAKAVLLEIRKVAAEEGVTKQAAHFHAEFEHHTAEAKKWQSYSVYLAIGLGLFAFLSLFIHKIPFLVPSNTYDAVQLSISKFLIFFVISYMLFLAAKNFLNHKHNAIINKHRQNALMTHAALVEASGEAGVRDAVLIQAASCIFSPQSTGYAPSDTDISSQKSVVEILSKPLAQSFKDI
ncbi:hypothetical protein ACQKEK_01195 [Pseudomonas sp. NPDC077408]